MIAGRSGLTRARDAVKCVLLFPVADCVFFFANAVRNFTGTNAKIRIAFSISGVNYTFNYYYTWN